MLIAGFMHVNASTFKRETTRMFIFYHAFDQLWGKIFSKVQAKESCNNWTDNNFWHLYTFHNNKIISETEVTTIKEEQQQNVCCSIAKLAQKLLFIN